MKNDHTNLTVYKKFYISKTHYILIRRYVLNIFLLKIFKNFVLCQTNTGAAVGATLIWENIVSTCGAMVQSDLQMLDRNFAIF